MTGPVIVAGVLLLAVMAAAWVAQRAVGNIGWVDVFWTFGVGLAGAGLALWPAHGAPDARQWLVSALVMVWTLRLGLYVAIRVATTPEDGRYVELREDWGPGMQLKLLGFVLLQAPVSLILSIAIMLAARNPALELGWRDGLGALIMLAAIGGEGLADEQMRQFKAEPSSHGKICERGLWSWSRHPNYFFEWLGWLAYPVIAWPTGGVYGWGWATWVAPVLMFLVLDRGTGIPPLEAHMAKSRGPAFADYQARVSRFFLLPPRQRPS